MFTPQTLDAVRSAWKDVYPRDKQKQHPGIVCPLCGSGGGPHGTGITENPQKPGQLKCWSCGFSGDVIKLAREDPKVPATTFVEAVRWVAERAGIALEETGAESSQGVPLVQAKDAKSRGDRTGLDGMSLSDPAAEEGRAYLARRGISLETAKKYHLRYDPVWRHPKAPESVPTSPRLIVPTSEKSCLARDIRALKSIPERSRPYAKSKVGKARLFNEGALRKSGGAPVIVVEGEFDALSVLEVGYQAVALGSVAYINKLLAALPKDAAKCPPLILALDDDEAGRECRDKLRAELLKRGVFCVAADICGRAKDANDALVADRGAFTKRIKAAAAAARGELTAKQRTAALERVAPHTRCAQKDSYIQALTEARNRIVSTGIPAVDRTLAGGLRPGIVALGGRTGTGKTSLIMQIAEHVAKERPVLYAALEMNRRELISKAIATRRTETFFDENKGDSFSALDLLDGRGITTDGKPPRPDLTNILPALRRRLDEFFESEESRRYVIMDGVGQVSLEAVELMARDMATAYGQSPLVVVDYLQLVPPEDPRTSDKDIADAHITAMKKMADELSAPVIAVSSFNRAAYDKLEGDSPDHERMRNAMESAFKESGSIEYTGDLLLGLRVVRRSHGWTDLDMYVVKNRWGELPAGDEPIPLSFYGRSGAIIERAEERPAQERVVRPRFRF